MRSLKRIGTAFAVLAMMIVLGGPASANDTICNGTLTGAYDNIVVPSGANCVLQGAQVKGNVLVLENGRLQANASTIGGNVQADKARSALLQFQTRVGGDVQIKNTTDASATSGFDIAVRVDGNAQLEGNRSRIFVDAAIIGGDLEVTKNLNPSFLEVEHNQVGGNIKIEENAIPAGTNMSIFGNVVGGNLGVFKNTGSGVKQVVLNIVRENLQCFENDTPFLGTPNTAGKREGQCAP